VNTVEVDQVRLAHLLQTMIEVRDAFNDSTKRNAVCDDLVKAFTLSESQQKKMKEYEDAAIEHKATLAQIAAQQSHVEQIAADAQATLEKGNQRIASAIKKEAELDEIKQFHDARQKNLDTTHETLVAKKEELYNASTKKANELLIRENAVADRETAATTKENALLVRETAIQQREANFLEASKIVMKR
jgi:hypothetical protein